MPVESGDTLILLTTQKREEQIQWQQNLRSKSDVYYLFAAKNQSREDQLVAVWVQKSYADDGRLGNLQEGEPTIVINDKFQYGQKNRAGDGRFVVFHDKANKMFQTRFPPTEIVDGKLEFIKNIGPAFVGEPLRDFVASS